MQYKCHTVSNQGETSISMVEAEDGQEAISKLRMKGLTPMSSPTPVEVSEDKEADPESEKEALIMMNLARFGQHVLTFVCKCLHDGIRPQIALQGMKDNDVEVPIRHLAQWLSDEGCEDDIKKLSDIINLDIHDTAEKMRVKDASGGDESRKDPEDA